MKISKGIIKDNYFILVYGQSKVGKTSFAAEAPNAIIVGPEDGSKLIDTSRASVSTYKELLEAITWLRNEKHEYQSVGIDSLDWIEPILWQELCSEHRVANIEAFGYGKGYTLALEKWADLINRLQDLRIHRQMNVIAIAHSQVKAFMDPMNILPYDRHTMKLNEKAGARWKEAVDAILFAAFEDNVFKADANDKKGKAIDGGRKLFTTRRASFDAGNRYGLPPEIALSWDAFESAIDSETIDQVKLDITEIAAKLDDTMKERIIAAVAKATSDKAALNRIRNHARVLTTNK